MRTAGIVIDAYKLPTFNRALNDAGFGFYQSPGPGKRTLILRVLCEDWQLPKLRQIVESANRESKR